MGAISFSIDENLIKELMKFLPLEIFIETGTFLGDSVECAGRYFEYLLLCRAIYRIPPCGLGQICA